MVEFEAIVAEAEWDGPECRDPGFYLEETPVEMHMVEQKRRSPSLLRIPPSPF